ncbi:MAG TPA: acyltransferase family protein [Candidatus Limnocylindrales bacterium]|nr:acyltransferase family protein [Candidatus Limnocylindrales bacterium]
MQHQQQGAAERFRPELEGLRGVAILLVLLFHADLPGAAGGFVGVDVFFVLSGFLITGLLIRERETTGRVDLRRFYARRARRILPAAAVVLVGALAASVVMLAPLDVPRVAGDVVASALSVGNIRFALEATDYFAAGTAPSPVLHYWSLGVEEQFYLAWPALLILATRGRRPKWGAAAWLLVILVTSYGAALLLTEASTAWAFYSLPTRAWQLALGGLLAATASWYARLPDGLAAGAGWVGLAAIVATTALLDPATPYPGLAALAPTLGAAGVILAGARSGSPGGLLMLPPLRFLGRISYSLYLVHWPLLVLPAATLPLGAELPLATRVGLAAGAVLLGWLCWRLVEQPFHRGPRLARSPGRTLAVAGTAVAMTVVFAAGAAAGSWRVVEEGLSGGLIGQPPATGDGTADALDPEPGLGDPGEVIDLEDELPAVEPSPTPLGSASGTPGASASASPTPRATQTPPLGAIPLPRTVRPSLADAPRDSEPLLRDGCGLGYPGTRPPECLYGDRRGAKTVALVGDSHAAQWFPALDRLARERGWRLVPLTKVSCRFVDLPMYSRELKRVYTECHTWRERVVERLQALKPDLVVVVVARAMQPVEERDNDPTRQGEALARLLARIPAPAAIIVDTPQSAYVVPSCISRNVNDVRRCETTRRTAFGWRYLRLEKAAAAATGARIVNLSARICPRDPCPVLLDGMIVYRDAHHLTATFAASLWQRLGALLPGLDPTATDSALRAALDVRRVPFPS